MVARPGPRGKPRGDDGGDVSGVVDTPADRPPRAGRCRVRARSRRPVAGPPAVARRSTGSNLPFFPVLVAPRPDPRGRPGDAGPAFATLTILVILVELYARRRFDDSAEPRGVLRSRRPGPNTGWLGAAGRPPPCSARVALPNGAALRDRRVRAVQHARERDASRRPTTGSTSSGIPARLDPAQPLHRPHAARPGRRAARGRHPRAAAGHGGAGRGRRLGARRSSRFGLVLARTSLVPDGVVGAALVIRLAVRARACCSRSRSSSRVPEALPPPGGDGHRHERARDLERAPTAAARPLVSAIFWGTAIVLVGAGAYVLLS